MKDEEGVSQYFGVRGELVISFHRNGGRQDGPPSFSRLNQEGGITAVKNPKNIINIWRVYSANIKYKIDLQNMESV